MTAVVVSIILVVLALAVVGLIARGRSRTAAPPAPRDVISPPPAPAPPEPAAPPAPATPAPATPAPETGASAIEASPEPIVAPPAAPPRGRVRSIGASLARIFRGQTLTAEQWEELEEILLRADVGVRATETIVGSLRARKDVTDGMAALRTELLVALGQPDRSLKQKTGGLTVWLITGVNGGGKTTTIGKLAAQLRSEGRTVVLAAADTFRAAADQQLERWGEISGAEVVKHAPGADPAAVVFDGVAAARARSRDVLIVDTAGRLQTKKNLMEELGKIKRVLEREAGEPDEVLLVLDATTGQNGVAQARAFAEAADVTGLVLTKLDGTAKGGIVIAVQQELGLPVKLVGLGEGLSDLAAFDPTTFIDQLLEV
jgi:fused signal recognition particle receptor